MADQLADRAAALRELADGDDRPLLLLRVGEEKNKKLNSMLDAALKSERFQLASKWFHCVRIDDSVLEKSHPHNMLFTGKHPARMLVSSRDGSKVVPFLGTTAQKVNWKGIVSVLKKDYAKDPTARVKGLERLLSKFDALDSKRKELNAQIERAAKKKQTSKIKALQAKLDKNEKARTAAMAKKAEFEKLVLRSAKKSKSAKAE